MTKKTPERLTITWCITPVNGCKQCGTCKRNKAMYECPEWGTFSVMLLSPAQKRAALEGHCAQYKPDTAAAQAQRLKGRREKTLAGTACAGCMFLQWGERSRAAIAYCGSTLSPHHGDRCPADKCGFYTTTSKKGDSNEL